MQISRIVELADRLEEDIRGRTLKPGDPYFGTEETARLLRVGNGMANRALQVLVQRGILRRRQRLGTFIARLPGDGAASPLARVHLLVAQDYFKTEGLLADGLVVGMQGALPGAEVQFNFLSPGDGDEYARRLVGEALRAEAPEGFVLVRSSLAVQRLVQSSGLPAVVHGTPYASLRGMAWVDRDHVQAADLLVGHLLGRGCRRIVVLLRQQMLPGDHLALDRILELAAAEGLAASDLVLRFLAADEADVAEEVGRLLADDRRPTGFFCRSLPLAEGVSAAVERLDGVAGQAEIVVSDVYRALQASPLPYVHARPVIAPEEIGRHIGRMLACQARGERPSPPCERLAVQLAPTAGPELSKRGSRNLRRDAYD